MSRIESNRFLFCRITHHYCLVSTRGVREHAVQLTEGKQTRLPTDMRVGRPAARASRDE